MLQTRFHPGSRRTADRSHRDGDRVRHRCPSRTRLRGDRLPRRPGEDAGMGPPVRWRQVADLLRPASRPTRRCVDGRPWRCRTSPRTRSRPRRHRAPTCPSAMSGRRPLCRAPACRRREDPRADGGDPGPAPQRQPEVRLTTSETSGLPQVQIAGENVAPPRAILISCARGAAGPVTLSNFVSGRRRECGVIRCRRERRPHGPRGEGMSRRGRRRRRAAAAAELVAMVWSPSTPN